MEDEETPRDYAKQVCRGIGWPDDPLNIRLFSSCITAIAFSRKLTIEGAFNWLSIKIRLAQRQGIKINYWFFHEAKYNYVTASDLPKIRKMKSERRESEGNGV